MKFAIEGKGSYLVALVNNICVVKTVGEKERRKRECKRERE